jgi:hypothetical protein
MPLHRDAEGLARDAFNLSLVQHVAELQPSAKRVADRFELTVFHHLSGEVQDRCTIVLVVHQLLEFVQIAFTVTADPMAVDDSARLLLYLSRSVGCEPQSTASRQSSRNSSTATRPSCVSASLSNARPPR